MEEESPAKARPRDAWPCLRVINTCLCAAAGCCVDAAAIRISIAGSWANAAAIRINSSNPPPNLCVTAGCTD